MVSKVSRLSFPVLPTFFYVALTIPGTQLSVLGKRGDWFSKDMNILVTVQVTLTRALLHSTVWGTRGVFRDIVVALPSDKGPLQNCGFGPALEDGVERALRRVSEKMLVPYKENILRHWSPLLVTWASL